MARSGRRTTTAGPFANQSDIGTDRRRRSHSSRRGGEFTTPDLGGNPYNYSDMTGSTLTGAPDTGTWSVVFDSQLAGAEWSRIGWTAQACSDSLITVSLATSTDNITYGTPVIVSMALIPWFRTDAMRGSLSGLTARRLARPLFCTTFLLAPLVFRSIYPPTPLRASKRDQTKQLKAPFKQHWTLRSAMTRCRATSDSR